MIGACPVCRGTGHASVWSSERAPVLQLVDEPRGVEASGFAPLAIVRCRTCGHLYNRAYARELADRMYTSDVVSNVPVHVSMSRSLEEIADWIGPRSYAGKRVVEVGGGSGHLARILARRAGSVVVFEPSAGLRAEMLPERNVVLVNDFFRAGALDGPAELVVCRQVLEHVAEPLSLLREVRAALSPEGSFYLEVPRAEYIEEEAALFDLHYAHVQYFHEENLLRLAAQAGFRPERSWHLKGGHDVGVLLRPGRESERVALGERASVRADDLPDRLARRRAEGRAFLAGLPGRVGLYGATWQGVAFLDTFQHDCVFAVVLDDNPDYAGRALYSRTQVVPVGRPTSDMIGSLDHVIVTAYLHDRVIEERLRSAGFAGEVFTLRTDPDAISKRAF